MAVGDNDSTVTASDAPYSPVYAGLVNGTDPIVSCGKPVQVLDTPEGCLWPEPGELLFKITGLAEPSGDGPRGFVVQIASEEHSDAN